MEIGSKLGKVLEGDVSEKGIQWGRSLCVRIQMDVTKKLIGAKKVSIENDEPNLCVRIQMDVTKKLIGAKKVSIENDEPRWVFFKYERLPKFCYLYGRIGYNEHECPEKGETNGGVEKEKYQYGAWLCTESMKHTGYSFEAFNRRSEEFD